MAFEVGQRVGEYEILDVLGAGGMGRVYRVRNVISNREEAMKVLLPDLTAEPELAVRFITEIRTLASFDHPNIAQLHTAFQVDNQLVMMMEFVEGFTLEQRAKQGAIPQNDVIEYILQILSALSYAHGRGVVHRDIKPANVMVTSHGIVKLMDFGIAKSSAENQLTRPGTTLGSLYYMSPEQVSGTTVDARSDLYSVGILLYELLAGRRPFEANTTYSVLNQQLNSPPQPPIEVNPRLSKQLNDLILFALAKDPAQRFQTAEAFRTALRAATVPVSVPTMQASAIQSPPAPPIPPPLTQPAAAAAPVPARRGQRVVWVAAGALVVIAIVIAAAIGLPHFLQTNAKNDGNSSASVSSPPTVPAASAPSAPQPAPAPTTSSAPRAPSRKMVAQTPPPVDQPPQPPAGPSPQEIDQARERFTQLDARASAVSGSIENLKRQQEADGYGLRGDISAAYTRMNSYMRQANSDLNTGNIDAAQKDMEKADKEISTLESFLGR